MKCCYWNEYEIYNAFIATLETFLTERIKYNINFFNLRDVPMERILKLLYISFATHETFLKEQNSQLNLSGFNQRFP